MKLAEVVPRYTLTPLRHTCSMLEFGAFSTMHEGQQADYTANTFCPESPCGLYCATFVKGDPASEHMAKVLDKTFKRILRTNWNPTKNGNHTRFCVYRIKED